MNRQKTKHMKSKKRLIYTSFGMLFLAGFTVLASRPVPPPARSQVLGAWSGYSDHLDFLRLELDNDGAGYLCVGWVGGESTALYRVQTWKYSDWKIDLTIHSIDPGLESVYLTNIICSYEDLKCEFGGTAGWKRKAKLIGEREWNRRSKPLELRIEAFRKKKQ
jgi:hypothetical protein